VVVVVGGGGSPCSGAVEQWIKPDLPVGNKRVHQGLAMQGLVAGVLRVHRDRHVAWVGESITSVGSHGVCGDQTCQAWFRDG
jgi:hypothetical protein